MSAPLYFFALRHEHRQAFAGAAGFEEFESVIREIWNERREAPKYLPIATFGAKLTRVIYDLPLDELYTRAFDVCNSSAHRQ